MNTTEYSKLLNQVRTQFLALARTDDRYNDCLRMLEYSASVHKGVRKDGVTREFYHQLSITGLLLTQHRNLERPHLVYQASLGHDIGEDYPDQWDILKDKFPEVYPSLWTLSKIRNGVKIPYSQYFMECATCPIASVVKPFDRLHNLSTMVGVFSDEKMKSYVDEVDQYFQPMIKRARRLHPRHADVMELAKSMLNDACHPLRFFLKMPEVAPTRVTEVGLEA